ELAQEHKLRHPGFWTIKSGCTSGFVLEYPAMDDLDLTYMVAQKFCPRCGLRYDGDVVKCSADNSDLLPVGVGKDRCGTVIKDKYVLVKMLGEGAFGQVYQATHLLAKADVAIKILREERRDDASARRQFLREARAVMRLRSKHACAIYDVDEDVDGSLFLVMELLKGPNLDDFRKQFENERMPWQTVATFASQVCEALEQAHEANVTHRDLKPANIMIESNIDASTFAKVVDFGIARLASAVDQESATTETAGKIMGTPAYMSPEQCRGADVDGRTDLYAVGCVIYELVSGERPFKANTSQGMIVAHVVEAPMPPRQKVANLAIPDALEALTMALLEKDPAKRPQTAREVIQSLESILSKDASTSVKRIRPKSGGIRNWVFVGLGVLVVLGLALFFVNRNSDVQPVQEETEAAVVQGQEQGQGQVVEAQPVPKTAQGQEQGQEQGQGQVVGAQTVPKAEQGQEQAVEAQSAVAPKAAQEQAAEAQTVPKAVPKATQGRSRAKAADSQPAPKAQQQPQVQAIAPQVAPSAAPKAIPNMAPLKPEPAEAAQTAAKPESTQAPTATKPDTKPARRGFPSMPDPTRMIQKEFDSAFDSVRGQAGKAFDALGGLKDK
ncbi:MAG TPA: protein kinase, partial [Myxococcota bacterium]|nr:protein kinase [Myxococcota bacterium]